MTNFDMEEGKILLFVNGKRGKITEPTLTGKAKIGGEILRLSAWKGKDGTTKGKISRVVGGKFSPVGLFEFSDNKGRTSDPKDKKPHKVGTLQLEGKEELKIAFWIRKGAKGDFLAGSVDKKKETAKASAAPSTEEEPMF
jgi:hypothetical protein